MSWRKVLRIIVLTISPAPARKRKKIESGKDFDRPNPIVARPYAITLKTSTFPDVPMLIEENKSPARTAPADGAAYKKPRPRGPIARISFAKIGRRTVAAEKKVAKKSRSIVL